MARKRTPKRVANHPHVGDELVLRTPAGPHVARVIAVDAEFVTFRTWTDGEYRGVTELSPADWAVRTAATLLREEASCG